MVFYLISSACHFHSAHMRPLFRFNILRFNSCVVVSFFYIVIFIVCFAMPIRLLLLPLPPLLLFCDCLWFVSIFLITHYIQLFRFFSHDLVVFLLHWFFPALLLLLLQSRQDNFSIRPIRVLMYAIAVPGQCVYECLFNRISTRINDTIR